MSDINFTDLFKMADLPPQPEYLIEVLNVVSHRDLAYVELLMQFFGENIVVTGTSKRDTADPVNQALGLQVAMLRALQSLTTKIERRVQGQVKHQDDAVAHQTALKEAAAIVKPKRKSRAKAAVTVSL